MSEALYNRVHKRFQQAGIEVVNMDKIGARLYAVNVIHSVHTVQIQIGKNGTLPSVQTIKSYFQEIESNG